MGDAAPLIEWPKPWIELIGFVGSFLAVGAVGFRVAVIGGRLASPSTTPPDRSVLLGAVSRAAWLGLIGAAVSVAMFVNRLPAMAARNHLTVTEILASNRLTQLQGALVIVALVGFALAIARVGFGWVLATTGVLVGPLSAGFFGQWNRLVNPMHRLAAGMWIGTLFVLVGAGLGTILRSPLAPARRGSLVAELVNAFSPLALVAAGVLATFGVITSWTHLHTLAALWTTPYGITLIIKLAMVAVVLGLDVWNWRRQKSRLGSEAGARSLQRSATTELVAAGLVLAITAILVSVPSPKRPGAEGGAPPTKTGL